VGQRLSKRDGGRRWATADGGQFRQRARALLSVALRYVKCGKERESAMVDWRCRMRTCTCRKHLPTHSPLTPAAAKTSAPACILIIRPSIILQGARRYGESLLRRVFCDLRGTKRIDQIFARWKLDRS